MSDFSIIEGSDDILDWVNNNKREVKEALAVDGTCILRGFRAKPDSGQSILETLGGQSMEEVFWSTPRQRVHNKTFTATEYASNREIFCHSEMSYADSYPRLICFHAQTCADYGGETTVADLDKVSLEVADILEEFQSKGVRYQRVFRDNIDIPIHKAFGVEKLEDVFEFAHNRGMLIERLQDNAIKISHSARAVLVDQNNSSLVWFNQANLYHVAALDVRDRASLEEYFGIDGVPRNASFADGSPIPDSSIEKVNAAFQRHARAFAWLPGDILILDNLRFAHGRRPFRGQRKIHVAMSSPSNGAHRIPLWTTVL